jgi:hypothetical protein
VHQPCHVVSTGQLQRSGDGIACRDKTHRDAVMVCCMIGKVRGKADHPLCQLQAVCVDTLYVVNTCVPELVQLA